MKSIFVFNSFKVLYRNFHKFIVKFGVIELSLAFSNQYFEHDSPKEKIIMNHPAKWLKVKMQKNPPK